jgi:hypothetical protein
MLTFFSACAIVPLPCAFLQTVFSMDPRQAGKNKLAEHKQYKTVPKFSSLATTQSGDVAVGADDGQIRLYNSISKVAKVS